MIDLDKIASNYQTLSVAELTKLAAKPEDLRPEVIPILQQALMQRGCTEEVIALSEYLVDARKKHRFDKLTHEELKQLIRDRLATGEPIESIKLDLKDDGIDLLDIIEDERQFKEKAFDYITQLKAQGADETEIDEKLKEAFSLEKEDSEQLRVQRKNNGKYHLIVGYTLVVLSLAFIITSTGLRGRTSFLSISMLVGGIWEVLKGHEQRKG